MLIHLLLICGKLLQSLAKESILFSLQSYVFHLKNEHTTWWICVLTGFNIYDKQKHGCVISRQPQKGRECASTLHRLTFHCALHCISHKRYGDEQCNDFLGWSGKEQELIDDVIQYIFMLYRFNIQTKKSPILQKTAACLNHLSSFLKATWGCWCTFWRVSWTCWCWTSLPGWKQADPQTDAGVKRIKIRLVVITDAPND